MMFLCNIVNLTDVQQVLPPLVQLVASAGQKNPQNLPLQKLNTGICPVGNPAVKKERKKKKETLLCMANWVFVQTAHVIGLKSNFA